MGYRFDRREDDPPGDVYFLGVFGIFGPMATQDGVKTELIHVGFESELFGPPRLIGRGGTYELKRTFLGRKKTVDVDGEAMVQFEQQGSTEIWHLLEGGRTLSKRPFGVRKTILDERGHRVVVARNGWTDQETQIFLGLQRIFRRPSWTDDNETVAGSMILFVDSQNLGPDLELVLATVALTC